MKETAMQFCLSFSRSGTVMLVATVIYLAASTVGASPGNSPSKAEGTIQQTAEASVAAEKKQTDGDDKDQSGGYPWLVVCLAGIFGGLLFGIRDKKLILPHRESTHIIEPGVITDILFGLGGGIVIFLIIPGELDPAQGSSAMIKLIGVAILGGYGGRALVEKVLQQQLKDLQTSVAKLKAQSGEDSNAVALVNEYLDDDPDKPKTVDAKMLRKAIAKASNTTHLQIFEKAKALRNQWCEEKKKDHLAKLVPIFEALIACDEKNIYHRNHGQLGYILKDKTSPDYTAALKELSTAIEIRKKTKVDGFLVYEFNRALCRIHNKESLENIKKDLNMALTGPKTSDWVKQPNPEKAPELVNWLQSNQSQLKDWIARNGVDLQAQSPP